MDAPHTFNKIEVTCSAVPVGDVGRVPHNPFARGRCVQRYVVRHGARARRSWQRRAYSELGTHWQRAEHQLFAFRQITTTFRDISSFLLFSAPFPQPFEQIFQFYRHFSINLIEI